MRTNIFQTLNIIVKSVFSILKMSIETINLARKKQLTPAWVDTKMHQWAQLVIGYTQANWNVINPHQVKPQHGQPTIIMCNHASLYDIPFSYLAFPDQRIRMLAKKELGKVPFFGQAMQVAGFPFIDRHNRHKAIEGMSKLREILAHDVVMWIAPEGTRSPDGKLAKFKKGGFITAIQTQATIIPLVIRGANLILPARSLKFSLNQKVDIIVGQPIDASEYHVEQKDELINLVHNTMQSMLDSTTN